MTDDRRQIKIKRKRGQGRGKTLLKIYDLLYNHYGHHRWWPGDTPFEIMIGAILTQNTAWTNVEKAIHNLKEAGVLTPRKLYQLPDRRLATLIKPSGFFNVKTKRVRAFLNYLRTSYNFSIKKMFAGETETLRTELLGVNGIGKETADSILLYAGSKPGFVVDAYTKRIFSRHGIFDHDLDYDEIKKLFEENLPVDVDLYNDYHAQIVNCGKDFCRPRPRCDQCPLRILFR